MNTRRGFGRGDEDPGRRARSEDEGRRWERSSMEASDQPYGDWPAEAGESERGPYWEERYSGRAPEREASTRGMRPTTRLHAFADGWMEPVFGERTGRWSGVGPRGYKRSDDRILDEINERLTRHPALDASDIEVKVHDGEVDLRGTVADRAQKRLAEDIAESVFAVRDLNNALKISSSRAPVPPPVRSSTSRNLVGGVISTQIQPEMVVTSSDSQELGKVKEVRRQHFLLDRPMARDLYVPFSTVLDVRANQVILSIIADRVEQMGWAKASEESNLEVPRA